VLVTKFIVNGYSILLKLTPTLNITQSHMTKQTLYHHVTHLFKIWWR